MALSAAIAISPSGSIPVGEKIKATITVSNSSGVDITLDQIIPYVKMTPLTAAQDASSVAIGKVIIDHVVPLMGSAIYILSLSFHANSKGSTYDVGCVVYGNGEAVSPTAATVTVI